MIRVSLTAFLLISLLSVGLAQVRHTSLTIEAHQIYDFGEATDILVADILIMEDSSSIKLNYVKDDNYIHCKKLIVGKGCKIIGYGENGRKPKDGGKGYSVEGPCHDGTNGRNGARGGDGINGNNLFLYADEIVFNGNQHTQTGSSMALSFGQYRIGHQTRDGLYQRFWEYQTDCREHR